MSQTDVAPQGADTIPVTDEFEALLEESFIARDNLEGTVVKGTVIFKDGDAVTVDVGLKTEGRVPMREFTKAGEDADLKVGDVIDVYLERIENALGDAVRIRCWPPSHIAMRKVRAAIRSGNSQRVGRLRTIGPARIAHSSAPTNSAIRLSRRRWRR